MASSLRVLNRHKMALLMLWFFLLMIFGWQTMVVMRLSNRQIQLTPLPSRVKGLENNPPITIHKNETTEVLPRKSNETREKNEMVYRRFLNAGIQSTFPRNTFLKPETESLKITSDSSRKNDTIKDKIGVANCTVLEEGPTMTLPQTKGTMLNQFKHQKIRLPEELMQKETMQWVESVNSTLVYSAYHDVDEPGIIKIVAICYRDTILPYFCQVWYKEPKSGTMTMIITNATYTIMNEPNRQYVGCFIYCDLPYPSTPFAVSVIHHTECLTAENLIEVKAIERKEYTRNFTMCHSALHHDYNNAAQLVEWVELNKALGADHFIVYNFSCGQSVQKVLEYYIRQGLVEVLQWSIPSMLIEERFQRSQVIHYFEQTSAYNDCLLRCKAYSKYIVVSDMDEFIVPHVDGAKTWMEMFAYLPEADSYQFKNCFFSILRGQSDWQYPEKEVAERYKITSLVVLKRHTLIWDNLRTKYIARTATAQCLKPHDLVGGSNYVVNSSIGLLHHYRNFRRIRNNVVIDETVLTKYGSHLANSVTEAWKEIEDN